MNSLSGVKDENGNTPDDVAQLQSLMGMLTGDDFDASKMASVLNQAGGSSSKPAGAGNKGSSSEGADMLEMLKVLGGGVLPGMDAEAAKVAQNKGMCS